MDILVKDIGYQTQSYTDKRARCLEEVKVIIAPVYQLCLIVTLTFCVLYNKLHCIL